MSSPKLIIGTLLHKVSTYYATTQGPSRIADIVAPYSALLVLDTYYRYYSTTGISKYVVPYCYCNELLLPPRAIVDRDGTAASGGAGVVCHYP